MVKERNIPSIPISARAQRLLKIKPHYEKKSSLDLLEIYIEQLYKPTLMCLGSRADDIATVVQVILEDRGFEKILIKIMHNAARNRPLVP